MLADERNWLAARYVLGELDPVETERAESLLASDQTFREAVAGEWELLHAAARGQNNSPVHRTAPAIASRTSLSSRSAGRASKAWGRWLSLSLVAGLAGVFCLSYLPTRDSQSMPDSVVAIDAEADEIADVLAWAHRFDSEGVEEDFVMTEMILTTDQDRDWLVRHSSRTWLEDVEATSASNGNDDADVSPEDEG